MPIFEQGDVVRVPFPYVERNRRQHRPALVVSRGGVGPRGALLWVVMITSAENEGWDGDVAIDNHESVGLPAPSVVRPMKIATIEASSAERVGRLPHGLMEQVMTRVQAVLARREH